MRRKGTQMLLKWYSKEITGVTKHNKADFVEELPLGEIIPLFFHLTSYKRHLNSATWTYLRFRFLSLLTLTFRIHISLSLSSVRGIHLQESSVFTYPRFLWICWDDCGKFIEGNGTGPFSSFTPNLWLLCSNLMGQTNM